LAELILKANGDDIRRKKAEAAALRALQMAPEDQTGLSLLGTAWRAMENGRDHDLNRVGSVEAWIEGNNLMY